MTTRISSENTFILLPPRGTITQTGTSLTIKNFLNKLSPQQRAYSIKDSKVKNAKIKVIDSIHENGAKLVQMTSDTMASIRSTEPGIRVVPLVYYKKATPSKVTILKKLQAPASSTFPKGILVVVTSKKGKQIIPVKDAYIVAFTDFANRIGDSGFTKKDGHISLNIKDGEKVERLYIYPQRDYWSVLKKNISVKNGHKFQLKEIDLSYKDALRYFYKTKLSRQGAAVKIGVLDTGVGPHKDLIVEGGENCVLNEDPKDFSDNGDGHGTHVAGIIAANGKAPKGVRGIFPGAIIRSYRVFGKNAEGATNYDIIKAIDKAVSDGCDILNMSLGGGPTDAAVQEAIADAFDKGTVCFVATGNDDREAVSFPASYSLSVAVSAMGRKGTFPAGTTHAETIMKPFGSDSNNFVASFSNFGSTVDFVAPGVGIISTVPGGYAAMDGTSMACPAATGIAARLLSAQKKILEMPRAQNRSVSMVKFLGKKARIMGFGILYEGNGLI